MYNGMYVAVCNILIIAYADTQKTFEQFCVCDSYIRLVCMDYDYVCLYLEAAVATVFEIATFPLANILHSRSIENGFFSF